MPEVSLSQGFNSHVDVALKGKLKPKDSGVAREKK
jgi:hypothetical protein